MVGKLVGNVVGSDVYEVVCVVVFSSVDDGTLDGTLVGNVVGNDVFRVVCTVVVLFSVVVVVAVVVVSEAGLDVDVVVVVVVAVVLSVVVVDALFFVVDDVGSMCISKITSKMMLSSKSFMSSYVKPT